jgi:hypothetical protein
MTTIFEMEASSSTSFSNSSLTCDIFLHHSKTPVKCHMITVFKFASKPLECGVPERKMHTVVTTTLTFYYYCYYLLLLQWTLVLVGIYPYIFISSLCLEPSNSLFYFIKSIVGCYKLVTLLCYRRVESAN